MKKVDLTHSMYTMINFVPFQENSVSINTGELMSMFWTIYDSCMVGSSEWKLLKGTIYKDEKISNRTF